MPGSFHFLSPPQELFCLDFEDRVKVELALRREQTFSRQFKVNSECGLSTRFLSRLPVSLANPTGRYFECGRFH